MPPAQNPSKKTGLMIIGGIFILIVTIILFALASNKPEETPPQTASESQQTTSNNALNETQSAEQAGPDFSALTERGIANRQIDVLQYAIYQYAQPNKIDYKNFVVEKGSVTHEDSSEDVYNTYSFKIKLNPNKEVKAKLLTSGLYTVRVVFYDPTSGAQLYDSKDVDARNI